MKKIILTAAAVFVFGFVNAQDKGFGFSKGNILVEGNLGFASSNDKDAEEKESAFAFTPQAGYFVTDKFALGLGLGFGSHKTTEAGDVTVKGSNFNVGVFGRYYFLDLGQRFKTYGQLGVDFINGKDGVDAANEVKTSGVNVGAGIGINYFVTDRIVLNFGLRNILAYKTEKAKGDGFETKGSSSFGFDLNSNIANPFAAASFGVGYKF